MIHAVAPFQIGFMQQTILPPSSSYGRRERFIGFVQFAAVLGPVILVSLSSRLVVRMISGRGSASPPTLSDSWHLAFAALCGAIVFAYPQRCPRVLCLVLVGGGP
jgi:hypothetical protein